MYHEITLTPAPKKEDFYASSLLVGQYAILLENYRGGKHIVTKVYGGDIVSITDPSEVWEGSCPLRARLLLPGEVITIKIRY